MRTLVAIVVRLFRRLEKPSRNDDNLMRFNLLNSSVINVDFCTINYPQAQYSFITTCYFQSNGKYQLAGSINFCLARLALGLPAFSSFW